MKIQELIVSCPAPLREFCEKILLLLQSNGKSTQSGKIEPPQFHEGFDYYIIQPEEMLCFIQYLEKTDSFSLNTFRIRIQPYNLPDPLDQSAMLVAVSDFLEVQIQQQFPEWFVRLELNPL